MSLAPKPLIIIGSGPAGLTAAIYAARARLDPLVCEGHTPGGQLTKTTLVENWPGIPSIMGPQLMIQMKEHALHAGATFSSAEISKLDLSSSPFRLSTVCGEELSSFSLIITTGTTPKRLNCPGEDEYWGRGVSTCAICDGILYRGKRVLVVGGGDTAMEEASFLARFAASVTVVHIRDRLSASAPMQQRVLSSPSISLIYSSTVTGLSGNGTHLTEAVITHQQTGDQTTLPVDGLFVAIGQSPNSGFIGNQLEKSGRGTIRTYEDTTQTSVPGVFAAGDVVDSRYRQAITSAGDGCRAALDAERFLAEKGIV